MMHKLHKSSRLAAMALVLAHACGAYAQESVDSVEIVENPVVISSPDQPLQVFEATDSFEICTDSLTVDGERVRIFNPNPTRAVWLSVLCPGLGQIYNRRYWKLPIVVGAYMGLAYATEWNNSMLRDYNKAYRDLMDNDPDTKSYMDFFAPHVREEDLSKSWLENIFTSRRNYFRRNRDLCIVGMIGVYLLAIVDAYVDASLAHFDISPNLAINWSPVLMPETRSAVPSVGVQWALQF